MWKSDELTTYFTLNQIGYTHRTVKHAENYVNPIDGTTTNHIENFWSSFENKEATGFMQSCTLFRQVKLTSQFLHEIYGCCYITKTLFNCYIHYKNCL